MLGERLAHGNCRACGRPSASLQLTASPRPAPQASARCRRATALPRGIAATSGVMLRSHMAPEAPTAAHAVSSQASSEPTAVSQHGLPRTAVVGVLGGGQLGRMMALAAANMGVTVKCLDPEPNAPASIAAAQTVGHFRDAAAITDFARGVDVITLEIEHIDADALQGLAEGSGADIEPTPATVRLIQDKHAQRRHFKEAGVRVGDFADAPDAEALQAAAGKFGYPLMLKSKRLAYDGRGNFVVRSEADLAKGVEALGGFSHGLYVEKWMPFVKELAVMVVRSRGGSVVSYPVVETIHKNNICLVTEAPAAVPAASAAAARGVAEKAVQALEGAGIFGVEMFLLPDGSITLNEVAPRPHNSGHYTQEACATSQFENHVRAVLGWPLGDPSLLVGSGLMLNILGEAEGDAGVRIAHEMMGRAYSVPGASVHWYGKPGMRPDRKVGHINIVAATREEGRRKLARIDPEAAAALSMSDAALAAVTATLSGVQEDGAQRQPKVGIIMGSDSDLPTMRAAAAALEEFGVPLELSVVSAHRTPERMMEYARSAHKRGLKVIIAGAGGAAHLPGMVAAMTPLPVIGVPVKPAGSHLDGLDALLSIVQMPRGVPVATVAIGNAANAGLLAIRILAASDPELQSRVVAYQEGMRDTVLEKAQRLEAQGWKEYKP